MSNQTFNKDWQKFFDISPSRIMVVDRKGHRTADGNTEKYNNEYVLPDSMNVSIRQMFRINWAWTETEFGITITQAKIVPLVYNNGSFYGKTTEDARYMRENEFNNPRAGVNALCQLSYTDKFKQTKDLKTGIFLPYYGSLEAFASRIGYCLVYSADNEEFKNIVRKVFQNELIKKR